MLQVEMVRLFTALVILSMGSCVTEPLPAGQTISVGTSSQGYLHDAIPLPEQGVGYRRLRPDDDTRYGTKTLVGAIERAARAVADAFPGGYPLRVGDLSGSHGGTHPRHRSHRSGRDADFLFYARDAGGLPTTGAGWLRFDRFGVSTVRGRVRYFDEARNWHLVRTLVMDPDARVKWLFCSNDLKARLLRHAVRYERSSQAVLRATWILHEPSHGDAHDDHFHLRVGCSRAEQSLGCVEESPHWPWLTDPARKSDFDAQTAAHDASLVRWLLAEEHVDERGHVAGGRLGATAEPTLTAGR